MSDDVLITPASRKIEFKDNAGNVDGKIELDANGNLNITSPGGDIGLGDATADVYIGDGTNNVDIVFEQNGEIRGLTGRTLTLGQSDSNVTVTAQNFTANGLSYPTSDGTNGQVLTTNGSGTLSFSTVSSSGAYDLNGGKLTIDADGDLYIEAPSDDYLTFNFINDDKFFMNQSMFGPVTGVTGTQLGSSNQPWQIGWIDYVYSTQLQAGTYNVETNGAIVFEGSTVDNYETGLVAADPTADRTITLPNATGTVPVFSTAPTSAITDGTNGQVLTTNGSGGLSFTTVSSSVTLGDINTAISTSTDNTNLGTNSSAGGGAYNTTYGSNAGNDLTSDSIGNTIIGAYAGDAITSGDENTAVGMSALGGLQGGSSNVAVGRLAMFDTVSSSDNVALGYEAGRYIGAGSNVAVGRQSLMGDSGGTTGVANTAVGEQTLKAVTSAQYNSVLGQAAGLSLTSGGHNTFLGAGSGSQITTGSKNVIIGDYNGNEGGLNIQTSDNNIVLSDGDGNIRQYINSSGDVGIGLVNPNAMLHVKSSGSNRSLVNFDSSVTNTGSFDFTEQLNGKVIFQGINSSGNEAVRLDPNSDSFLNGGNLGIGTAVPGNKLHVHGAAEFNSYDNTSGGGGYNASGLLIGNAYDAGKGSSVTDDRNAIIWNERGLDIDFGTNNTQRMKLDYNGKLLVGKTASSENTAGTEISSDGYALFTRDGSRALALNRITDNGEIQRFMRSGSNVGNISVTTSSTSYNTSSDHRLKDNVADMTGAIARVKALAPKRFNFIADADTTVDGFLAHEAQAVVPEAVTGTHNEVDDDGNAVMQGIDQSKLVPLLTGALQEAIAKIETLETQVTDLTARVVALESA